MGERRERMRRATSIGSQPKPRTSSFGAAIDRWAMIDCKSAIRRWVDERQGVRGMIKKRSRWEHKKLAL